MDMSPNPLDFNPHHHAGGDANSLGDPVPLNNFNPHHHAGGDDMSDPELNDREISIHTTTQVVTDIMEALQQQNKISIHTTTQVVTCEK